MVQHTGQPVLQTLLHLTFFLWVCGNGSKERVYVTSVADCEDVVVVGVKADCLKKDLGL